MSGVLNRSLQRPGTGRKLDDDDSCVKVALNIRPLIDIELAAGCQEAIIVEPGHPQVDHRVLNSSARQGHAMKLQWSCCR